MMDLLWFISGVVFGCVYIGLQWVQVEQLHPSRTKVQLGSGLLYILRMLLFTTITGLALQEGLVYGMEFFGGFWVTRSLMLIFICSGSLKMFGRSDS